MMGPDTRPGVLTLTDDVILEMEILERGRTSQGRCGDALQSVSVQTQLLKYVLFTKDPDKLIEIERYIVMPYLNPQVPYLKDVRT